MTLLTDLSPRSKPRPARLRMAAVLYFAPRTATLGLLAAAPLAYWSVTAGGVDARTVGWAVAGAGTAVAALYGISWAASRRVYCPACGQPSLRHTGKALHAYARRWLGISYVARVAWDALTSDYHHCMYCHTRCRNSSAPAAGLAFAAHPDHPVASPVRREEDPAGAGPAPGSVPSPGTGLPGRPLTTAAIFDAALLGPDAAVFPGSEMPPPPAAGAPGTGPASGKAPGGRVPAAGAVHGGSAFSAPASGPGAMAGVTADSVEAWAAASGYGEVTPTGRIRLQGGVESAPLKPTAQKSDPGHLPAAAPSAGPPLPPPPSPFIPAGPSPFAPPAPVPPPGAGIFPPPSASGAPAVPGIVTHQSGASSAETLRPAGTGSPPPSGEPPDHPSFPRSLSGAAGSLAGAAPKTGAPPPPVFPSGASPFPPPTGSAAAAATVFPHASSAADTIMDSTPSRFAATPGSPLPPGPAAGNSGSSPGTLERAISGPPPVPRESGTPGPEMPSTVLEAPALESVLQILQQGRQSIDAAFLGMISQLRTTFSPAAARPAAASGTAPAPAPVPQPQPEPGPATTAGPAGGLPAVRAPLTPAASSGPALAVPAPDPSGTESVPAREAAGHAQSAGVPQPPALSPFMAVLAKTSPVALPAQLPPAVPSATSPVPAPAPQPEIQEIPPPPASHLSPPSTVPSGPPAAGISAAANFTPGPAVAAVDPVPFTGLPSDPAPGNPPPAATAPATGQTGPPPFRAPLLKPAASAGEAPAAPGVPEYPPLIPVASLKPAVPESDGIPPAGAAGSRRRPLPAMNPELLAELAPTLAQAFSGDSPPPAARPAAPEVFPESPGQRPAGTLPGSPATPQAGPAPFPVLRSPAGPPVPGAPASPGPPPFPPSAWPSAGASAAHAQTPASSVPSPGPAPFGFPNPAPGAPPAATPAPPVFPPAATAPRPPGAPPAPEAGGPAVPAPWNTASIPPFAGSGHALPPVLPTGGPFASPGGPGPSASASPASFPGLPPGGFPIPPESPPAPVLSPSAFPSPFGPTGGIGGFPGAAVAPPPAQVSAGPGAGAAPLSGLPSPFPAPPLAVPPGNTFAPVPPAPGPAFTPPDPGVNQRAAGSSTPVLPPAPFSFLQPTVPSSWFPEDNGPAPEAQATPPMWTRTRGQSSLS